MTTIGEEVLRRLEVIENQMANGGFPDATPIHPDQTNRRLTEQLAELRDRVERMSAGPDSGASRPMNGMNPKDVLPEILGNNYKEDWRTWAYKARDYLSMWDPTLNEKLEGVECMAAELSDDYISSLNISPQTDAAIKRLLVHRLKGDPGEIVRNKARKSGVEQYRSLAQLCDPSAGGRNFVDA